MNDSSGPEMYIGKKFGRFVVESICDGYKNRSISKVSCVCECGKRKDVLLRNVLNGKSSSCGCYRSQRIREIATTHGLSNSRTYGIWNGMIQRCTNSNRRGFPDYGGRGIGVCQRWLNSFEAFLEDMGHPPSRKHSIERIENDGNYEPVNCRWATSREQSLNKSTNRWITFGGRTQCLEDWAKETGIDKTTIFNRLKAGWEASKALAIIPSPQENRVSPVNRRDVIAWHGVFRFLVSNGGSVNLYDESKIEKIAAVLGWKYIPKKTAKAVMSALYCGHGKLKKSYVTLNSHCMVSFSLPDVLTV
jgi:hypothetical protein